MIQALAGSVMPALFLLALAPWVNGLIEMLGAVCTPLGSLPGGSALGWTESLRGEHVHWRRLGADGLVDRLRVRAAFYCNWPVVPLTVPGNMAPDFPLINKSFELCYSCQDR